MIDERNRIAVYASSVRPRSSYRAVLALGATFTVGTVLTLASMQQYVLQYIALTVLSTVSAFLILQQLRRPLSETFPFWVILTVFVVAYYLQFYAMLVAPDFMPIWVSNHTSWILDAPPILIRVYAIITCGFTVFCLTGTVLLRTSKSVHCTEHVSPRIVYKRVFVAAVFTAAILIVATSVVMYATGASIMSSEAVYLPFRLAGWVFYARTVLVPALILLCAWSGQKAALRSVGYFTAGLVCFHAGPDMLLRGSKGSLLAICLMLVFLFIVSGVVRRKHLLLLGGVLFVTVSLAWPFFGVYRYMRAEDSSAPIGEAIFQSADKVLSAHEELSVLDSIVESCSLFFFRLSGAACLSIGVAADVPPLLASMRATSVNRYFTVDIMGYPPDAAVTYGSSLLGWFYLVGGTYLVVAGSFLWTMMVWMIWRVLWRTRFYCIHIAQTLALFYVLVISSAGGIDDQYLPILAVVGSVVLCEQIVRACGRIPNRFCLSSYRRGSQTTHRVSPRSLSAGGFKPESSSQRS